VNVRAVLIAWCASALNVAEEEKKSFEPSMKGWHTYIKENPKDLEDLRQTVSGKLIKLAGKAQEG